LGDIAFKTIGQFPTSKLCAAYSPLKKVRYSTSLKFARVFEKLRYAYGEMGYINSTFVPDMQVDEERQKISLIVDMDEGKSFTISSIDFIGLDEDALQSISKGLYFKRGDVYNQRLVSHFMHEHASLLPINVSPDSRIRFDRDNKLATIGVAFDFRDCPSQ